MKRYSLVILETSHSDAYEPFYLFFIDSNERFLVILETSHSDRFTNHFTFLLSIRMKIL